MIRVLSLESARAADVAHIMLRAHADIGAVAEQVRAIIDDVRKRGDEALIEYTRKWDDPEFNGSSLVVHEADFAEAYDNTPEETIRAIREQIALSRKFHRLQRSRIVDWEEESEPGITVGEKWTPIPNAGLYVPGGKNPFPTVQQILGTAAQTAGCERIASCISPRGKNYEVLIAAAEVGLSELYRVSGPHAIAAMAYGTKSIKPVDIIAGPGNPYVTAAKVLCQEKVAIDMPAGPSEAIMLADGSLPVGMSLHKKASYLAADILARAEHGPDSAGVLVTDSRELVEAVQVELEKQVPTLSRQGYIKEALSTYCAIILTRSLSESIEFTNEYAPEHLEILCEDPRAVLEEIRHAGSVFLGYYNPVATGDYASGVNHILPTGAWARRSSSVAVWTFMKRVQFSEVTKDGLRRLQPIVDTIADVEGLDAHRRSVDIRFEDDGR